MKRIAMVTLLALMLAPAASFAQVAIRIGPPAPVVEVRGNPPDRGYVWNTKTLTARIPAKQIRPIAEILALRIRLGRADPALSCRYTRA